MSESILSPEAVVRSFGLKPGDVVADFGAGHGFFTVPIAVAVGSTGKVYAIDVQKSVLEIIRSRARQNHITQIEARWADLDQPQGSGLPDESVDAVLIANILFQAEQKENIFAEAYRILRPGGKAIVIEWDETPSALGPPVGLRISKSKAEDLAKRAGFARDSECDSGAHHYGFFVLKPSL
ncbi:MAG: methyltransferase domain-containing protein [Candidatus Sungbacteria bacterium]|nr:methyltransferase domain-containing protein [Candidatus Sungbacteria bacterium]